MKSEEFDYFVILIKSNHDQKLSLTMEDFTVDVKELHK